MKSLVQLAIGSLTVAMESAGESYIGQLAVAWSLQNRVNQGFGTSLSDVCLKAMQYSAWNTDSPTRMNVDQLTERQIAVAMRATNAVMYNLEPDPTHGAVFYMNIKTVLRVSGKLPGWWDIDGDPSSEIKIGAHTFRRKK